MSRLDRPPARGPAEMTFADAFDALAATSDGTLCTLIVMEEDRGKLVAAAERGDERALMLIKAMVGCIEALEGTSPAQCGCCDRAMVLSDLAGCGVVTTAMEGAGNMLVLNICLACGPTRRAALAGVASALARLRPECRQVTVHGTAGRA